MLFFFVCVEGESSEPAFVRGLTNCFKSQAPQEIAGKVEIIPLPFGGNQGHNKIIEKADKMIENYLNTSEGQYFDEENDSKEKWIIIDYDRMEEHGVEPNIFVSGLTKAGYKVIILDPNFEAFLLGFLFGNEESKNIKIDEYDNALKDRIDEINQDMYTSANRGLKDDALTVPYYRKKHKEAANVFFEKLFSLHKGIVDQYIIWASDELPYTKEAYRMVDFILSIKEIFGEK